MSRQSLEKEGEDVTHHKETKDVPDHFTYYGHQKLSARDSFVLDPDPESLEERARLRRIHEQFEETWPSRLKSRVLGFIYPFIPKFIRPMTRVEKEEKRRGRRHKKDKRSTDEEMCKFEEERSVSIANMLKKKVKQKATHKKLRIDASNRTIYSEINFPEDIEAVEFALQDKKTVVLKHAMPVIKPSTDRNEYKPISLGNGMKVLLVRDSQTTRSAVALSVAAGTLSDPIGIPGLAHFVEHMLFVSCDSCSDGSFDDFMTDFGGTSKAETKSDSTTYGFEIERDYFHEAVRRFVQFFNNPIFDEEIAEIEMSIIDSEHLSSVTNELYRILRVDASTADQAHPYSRFTTGNKETLFDIPIVNGLPVNQMLDTFFNEYYHAHLMTLVLYGSQSMDELQHIAEKHFGNIKDEDRPVPAWPFSPYKELERGLQIDIVPNSNIKQLYVRFYIPDPTPFYKTGITKYFSYIFEHEGIGGLVTVLKNKGWIAKLGAAISVGGRGFAFFTIKVDLTVRGWGFKEEILVNIFQFIEMMRQDGPNKQVWKEISQMEAIKFDYKEQESILDYSFKISVDMQKYPMKEVLVAEHLITQFNIEYFKEIMEYLKPEKCRIITVGFENIPNAGFNEQWYGVSFNLQRFSVHLLSLLKHCGLNAVFRFPPKNEFIPNDLKIKMPIKVQGESKIPRLVRDSEFSRVWFIDENPCNTPTGLIKIEFYAPLPRLDPFYTVLNEIYVNAIYERGYQQFHLAKAGGLNATIVATPYGFQISLHGFTDKMENILLYIFSLIFEFRLTETQYRTFASKWKGTKEKIRFQEPYALAFEFLKTILVHTDWSNRQLLKAYKEANYQWIFSYSRMILAEFKMHWLIIGNFVETEILKVIDDIDSKFLKLESKGLPLEKIVRKTDILIPRGVDHTFRFRDGLHISSGTIIYFQLGETDLRSTTFLELTYELMQDPCFQFFNQTLRLGYICNVLIRKSNGFDGLIVNIQTERSDSLSMEQYVSKFVRLWKNSMHKLIEDKKQIKLGDGFGFKRPNSFSLAVLGEKYWKEITTNEFMFNRHQLQVELLKESTVEDFLNFLDELLGPPWSNARRINLHIIGNSERSNMRTLFGSSGRVPKLVRNMAEWKEKVKNGKLAEEIENEPLLPMESNNDVHVFE